jgi:Aerotolerance regulator N-terminal/von Willebrand factor type A domain
MGGLGFIHLGFLAAGAAVAVPIVIHLLFRQRARRVEIGTIYFLRVVLQDQARRRKIRRWLLLALRAAGVLLLALLFARPFWRAPETLGSEREVVVLIDRSASMAAGTAGATPFDKAQRRATELITGLPLGSAVNLAYFDADDVAPARESKIDPAMRPVLAGTDYTKGLGWARDIIVASRRLKRQVFLLTDLQRSGIGLPLADSFSSGTEVEIIDVGHPLTTNLAVEDVLAERTELKGGNPPVIAARVYNAGVFPARDLRVRLSLNGKPAVEKTVSIDGRSRQLVRFEAPVNEPGMYQGFVEVAAHDELRFDDRRWLAFQARRPDRVLLIDGQPGPSVFGDETYYLETALRLRLPGDESAKSPSPYEPTRVAWSGSDGSLPDLSPYHVVALCNVPDISAADANILARFVEAGGNLIIFTGDRVEAGAYATLLRAGVLPAEVQGPAETGSYRFTEWYKNHPILSPFSDPQYGDLRTLRFQKITRLQPEPQARVLASVQGGAPLIVERMAGQGRCILFAIPADNGWGDWAIHRLYLPLVHQLLGYLTERLPETDPVKYKRADETPAQAPGVTMSNGRAIVRNVDPAESNIERTTVAQLRETYRLPDVAKTAALEHEDESKSLAGTSERPDEFWRTIAWALLVVLVLETFVANRTYA